MSNRYLERLLIECLDSLVELGAERNNPNGKVYKTYLKVKAQLDNKCATCDKLMDMQNCCIIDVKGKRVYHPGCEPIKYDEPEKLTEQKRILGLIERSKEMDDSSKIDLVLEVVWGLMSR